MASFGSWIERASSQRWFLPSLAAAGVLALAVIGLAGWTYMSRTNASAPGGDPAGQVSNTLPAAQLIDPRIIDPANGSKFSYLYLQLFAAYQQGGQPAAEGLARELDLLDEKGVHAVLVLKDPADDAFLNRLKASGVTVDLVVENRVGVSIPADKLMQVNANKDFTFVRELLGMNEIVDIEAPQKPKRPFVDARDPAMTQLTGEFQVRITQGPTEGVARTGADKWHAANLRGNGVKVGIIDSFGGYRELLGSRLPPSDRVQIRDFSGSGIANVNQVKQNPGLAHGTACAQIITEMAPGVSLFLGELGDVTSFLAAMDWMIQNKVDIISLSLGFDGLQFDGSAITSRKIDQARQAGILVVTAAGNEGDSVFIGRTPAATGFVEFGADTNALRVLVPDRQSGGRVFLSWQNPQSDLVLHILDKTAQNRITAVARTNASQAPAIEARLSRLPQDEIRVAVEHRGGPATLFRVKVDQNLALTPLFRSAFMSLGDLPSSKGALGVGAAEVRTDRITTYSSWGPSMDGRWKPEIVAPTHVSSNYFTESPVGFNGTSAATPHVAGAAALVKGRFPNFTADQVTKFLLDNAVEVRSPEGPRGLFTTGAGRLNLPDPSTLR